MDRDAENLLTGVLLSKAIDASRKPVLPPAPSPADGPRYVYDPPSVRSSGNTFKNWGEVEAAILTGQAAPTVVFARPGQYQIAMGFNLRRGKLASLTPATGQVTVTLADDVQIDNIAGIEDGIGLIVKPKTRPCFTFTDYGPSEPVVFAVRYGAALQNLSTTGKEAFPIVGAGKTLVLAFFTASQRAIPPSTAPFVRCNGGTLIAAISGGFAAPYDGWAEDTGTSTLFYQCDSTFPEVAPLTPGFAPSNVVRFQASLSRSVAYTPSNPADWLAWTTVAPDNVGQALDLLAAKP